MMTGFGMGFSFLGVLLMVLFWGVLIALAVWLVRALFNRAPQSPPFQGSGGTTAQQILDARYARGEITKEQYELMKQDLRV
jgi:putative membrane protein